MKRTPEVKEAIRTCNKLINRIKAISVYKYWKKRDFVTCQASHENLIAPSKSDHVAAAELITRFAIRNDISVEFKAKPIKKAVRKSKVRTYYNGKNGFTRWRKVRYEALIRSNGLCECCGATVKSSGEPLHVDHIKPKSLYPELQYQLSNLQILCADCNVGKGNWDETNWRKNNAEREVTEELDSKHLAEITRIY